MPQLLLQYVVVISDLHVGDPNSLNLEDFDRDEEFERLLLIEIPKRVGWPVTLVIAGDFIDFPQVLPKLSNHSYGDRFGTTEAESLRRLECVIAGHPRVFEALDTFIRRGGQVRLLPGNHDVDYHWPAVENRLRESLGGHGEPGFGFVCSGEISERGVHIEHGNQYSFDNRFDHWRHPILEAPDGPRLERPWGTLFMDLVYNDAESAYPFVNKIHPKSALALIVGRGLASGQVSKRLAGRLVAFFASKGKRFIGEWLLGRPVEVESPAALDSTISLLFPDIGAEAREELLIEAKSILGAQPQVLPNAVGLRPGLLGRSDEVGMKKRSTELLSVGGAVIVVFGHTHVIVDGESPYGVGDPRRVFNAGTWIPRIAIDHLIRPTIADVASFGVVVHKLRFVAISLGHPPTGRLEEV